MIAVVHCLAAGFSERLVRTVEVQHLGDLAQMPSLPAGDGEGGLERALMETAFQALMGRRPYERSGIDAMMMERAWSVAREAGFDGARIRKALLSSGEGSCQEAVGRSEPGNAVAGATAHPATDRRSVHRDQPARH